ncbi:MAG: hypothetical protein OXK79_07155, partial [Chloroflexota bacterium]|nr:hypothetical protein [Chloroflexota bacterium]
ESTNVAANLTVSTTADAFVLVTAISGDDDADGNPTDASGLMGTVDVEVSVERGNQTFEKLSLNVDGMEVASQDFGAAAAADDAEQTVHTFTLSFDSDGYDSETGAVDYMNGEHSIQALLKVAGRDDALMSNMMPVEFANEDGLHVAADFPGNSATNPETGEVWYGGPDAGDFTIMALPVSYSGTAAESVTLLGVCGADAITDGEAPYEFTLECKESGSVTPKFSVLASGEAEELSPVNSSIFPLNLDYEGPPAPYFHPNPNDRQDGWVNLTVDFLGEYKSSNEDGWLTYNKDDGGVGGYIPRLRVSTAAPTVVGGALAAGVVEGVPALPPEGTKANAVCAVVTAVDLLGNESKLPKADKACATHDVYQTAVDALKAAREDENDEAIAEAQKMIPAGIRAGLDIMPPTIEFSPASPKENATSLKEFQVQVADVGGSTGKSGLHSMPVLAKIEVRNAKDETICGDQDDVGGPVGEKKVTGCMLSTNNIDFRDPLATTQGLSGDPKTHGYYTFTAMSRDRAGNESEELVRTAVNDNEAPQVGLIVGGYSKGAYTLTVTATDDLSIKAYWPEQKVPVASITADASSLLTGANFSPEGTALTSIKILPSEGAVMVDEYNGSLTQDHLETITMKSFRAVQNNTALTAGDATNAATTTPLDPGDMLVVAVDQAGSADSTDVDLTVPSDPNIFGIRATGTGTDSNGNTTTTNPAIPVSATDNTGTVQPDPKYKRDQVFQTFSADKTSNDDDVVELRAEIVGIAGYKAAVAGSDNDTPADATDDTNAAAGEEGLVDNPVSRVDFYALVALKNRSTTNTTNRVPPVVEVATATDAEALVLIASVSAAGAEDFTHNNGTTANTDAARADDYAARRYVWSADVGAAEVLAAIGSKKKTEEVQFIAVAVNSAGVAIIDAVSSDANGSDVLSRVTVAP